MLDLHYAVPINIIIITIIIIINSWIVMIVERVKISSKLIYGSYQFVPFNA